MIGVQFLFAKVMQYGVLSILGGNNMKFGMPTLIEIPSLADTMKLCNELRLDFVELNMNLPQYQIESLENTAMLLCLAKKYNIGYTIHLDENLNVCDFNTDVANAYMNTVKQAIRIAKIINAPILNMHMNHGVHFTLPDRKVKLFEMYNDEYMRSWKQFREMCEKEIGNDDIRICIENTDGYTDYEKSAIEYLIERDCFYLTCDIGHLNSAKNVDEDFIMQHQDKLSHFHIHDSLGTKNHMILGTGEIDLLQRLSIAQKYNCRCVVETKTVEALKQSVDWLSSCYGG